jgi:ketosteroid isomerase-like protein
MSKDNLELWTRALAAFNRTIVDGSDDFFDLLDEEVDWTPITAQLDGVTYRGRDAVRQWVVDLRRDWESYELTADEVLDLGERGTLALGSWRARGRRSGVELQVQQAAWLTTYGDGKITSIRTFTDQGDALQAAGLA